MSLHYSTSVNTCLTSDRYPSNTKKVSEQSININGWATKETQHNDQERASQEKRGGDEEKGADGEK